MNKFYKAYISLVSTLIALCILTVTNLALAEEDAMVKINGAFGASTDYLWRGLTFSKHKPILKGGMVVSSPLGLSLGTWVSTSQGWGSSNEPSTFDTDENETLGRSEENGLETFIDAKYKISLGEHFSFHLASYYFYYAFNEASRYGRSYVGVSVGTGPFSATMEAGFFDYESKNWPSKSDSTDYRVMLSMADPESMADLKLMFVTEDNHFLLDSGYKYYEAKTTLTPPMESDLLKDFSLGITLGYADYESEKNVGRSSYFHYRVSLNKTIDNDFKASLFISDTEREAVKNKNGQVIPLDGGRDRSIGLTFFKTF